MGTRIELPEGNWAVLRDPMAVPERLRRPIVRVSADLGNMGVAQMAEDAMPTGAQLDVLGELNDLLIVALVTEWSFETQVTLDAVLDLPGAIYDGLREAVAPLVAKVLPDFSPRPEPDSPTGP